ncbi:MAG: alkaline phosphatase family protein [Methylomonas sp.]|jgi:predicted AlkP superfamily pyrophosphatase or phosphodiesterase|uniref:alkaline phosphatase family protein n=1 Tax=Methylomonas sp. TaxID=418 RepID=UPI0025D78925|nr:nucleotide pyrophosphatase/phosphodiesterase family protein [Methylomonas sp.]MCK9607065.1 alkaline phosphatase family protein [Methylomonas sp.]
MINSNPLLVINVVGLSPSLLGKHTPNLNSLINQGYLAELDGVFPAVTCTAQATMLTGTLPREHGIVANGWYFRELAEIGFWKQANQLIQREQVWESLKKFDPAIHCAQMFWWYNMYAHVDFSVTPRPIYPADGRKIPAIYSSPMALGVELENELGPFPMFNFWGPTADIRSSQWIADAATQVWQKRQPALEFVYLPHLDYNLQRLGPNHPDIWQDVKKIDTIAGQLIDSAIERNGDVLIVSEYGIEPAEGVVHINRVLREHGFIAVRETLGWELLDCGASRAFAVADHQAAHIYVRAPDDVARVKKLLQRVQGIEFVLDKSEQVQWGLDHPRSGELVVMAAQNQWFSYYYWLDEQKAPDFARTVDIHRKPGYDPVELFLDPNLKIPQLKIGFNLLKKKLGFRMLMDVIPLMPELVQGTHGRHPSLSGKEHGPLLIGSNKNFADRAYAMTDVSRLIKGHFSNS